jgi:hypothetical protein
MTSCFLLESTYAQPNPFEGDYGLLDHRSHDVHEGTIELSAQTRVQPTHPEIPPFTNIQTWVHNPHHLPHLVSTPRPSTVSNNSLAM